METCQQWGKKFCSNDDIPLYYCISIYNLHNSTVCDISWSSCLTFIAMEIREPLNCCCSACDFPAILIKLDTCSPAAAPKKFIPALSTVFLTLSDHCTVRVQRVTLCPLCTSSSPSAVGGERCSENGGANIRIDRRCPSASSFFDEAVRGMAQINTTRTTHSFWFASMPTLWYAETSTQLFSTDLYLVWRSQTCARAGIKPVLMQPWVQSNQISVASLPVLGWMYTFINAAVCINTSYYLEAKLEVGDTRQRRYDTILSINMV